MKDKMRVPSDDVVVMSFRLCVEAAYQLTRTDFRLIGSHSIGKSNIYLFLHEKSGNVAMVKRYQRRWYVVVI